MHILDLATVRASGVVSVHSLEIGPSRALVSTSIGAIDHFREPSYERETGCIRHSTEIAIFKIPEQLIFILSSAAIMAVESWIRSAEKGRDLLRYPTINFKGL